MWRLKWGHVSFGHVYTAYTDDKVVLEDNPRLDFQFGYCDREKRRSDILILEA